MRPVRRQAAKYQTRKETDMGEKLRKMVMKRKGLCDLVVGATRVQGPEIGCSHAGEEVGAIRPAFALRRRNSNY